jgi:hypothetical protein
MKRLQPYRFIQPKLGLLFQLVNRTYFLGFEIITEVTMKCTVFWDMTLCSLVDIYRRFGGPYCLCLQVRRLSRVGIQQDSVSNFWLPAWLILWPSWYITFLRNVGKRLLDYAAADHRGFYASSDTILFKYNSRKPVSHIIIFGFSVITLILFYIEIYMFSSRSENWFGIKYFKLNDVLINCKNWRIRLFI